MHPTIVDGIRPDDDLYFTETFGPLVGVGTFSTMDEAIALANGHGYGLSSAIYTNSPQWAFQFRAGISAGMLSVNNSTAGATSARDSVRYSNCCASAGIESKGNWLR